MKIFNKISFYLIAIAAVFFMACDEEEGRVTWDQAYVELGQATVSVQENGTEVISVPVHNVGPTLDSDIVVNYGTAGSTAVPGVDFEFVAGSEEGRIVIPAGQNTGFLKFRPIDNVVSDGTKTYNLNLRQNSAGLGQGRGAVGIKTVVTISDDDCPLADGFEGIYNVDEVFTDGINEGLALATAFGESYEIELTLDTSDPSGTTFIITNTDGSNTYVADGTTVKFITCEGTLQFSANPLEIALFSTLTLESTSYDEDAFSLTVAGPLGNFGPYEFKWTKQ